jgi:hypothetical protein
MIGVAPPEITSMPINLRSRSILTLEELSSAEIRFLLRLAAELKAAKAAGIEKPRLKGKNIALIFEKDSTRTRTGFEVAAYDQGAHVTYLGPTGSQIGHKESMKDTARVLGRIYDAIEYRGFIVRARAGPVLGRSRVQRSHRRGPSDADPRGLHDDARVHPQAPLRHDGGVHGRCPE